jgi:predicted dehydrogenase
VKHADVAIRTREGSNEPFEPQPVPPELDYEMYVGPIPWTDYHPERVHYKFRFVSDFSGGEIANWGAHFLDSAQQALGLDDQSPVRVRGTGKRHPPGSIHSSFFDIDVHYEYADGRTLRLTSAADKTLMGITFRGEHATLFVNRDEFTVDKPELLKSLPKEEARAMAKTQGSHMENWLACVRSRRKADLHAPPEIGHRSAILCHLANLAIEVGRPLTWDEERESFVNDAFANALLNRPVRGFGVSP